jgi:hypothetical protein
MVYRLYTCVLQGLVEVAVGGEGLGGGVGVGEVGGGGAEVYEV